MADKWTKPYSREYAAYPAPWLRAAKFWPTTCTSLFLYTHTQRTGITNLNVLSINGPYFLISSYIKMAMLRIKEH